MKSRERVVAALENNYPDRPPRDLWTLPFIRLFREKEYNELLGKFPLDFYPACEDPAGPLRDMEKLMNGDASGR